MAALGARAHRGGNPYRGWTLVERGHGYYMTRDDAAYVRVAFMRAPACNKGVFPTQVMHRFHQMVDEREDGE